MKMLGKSDVYGILEIKTRIWNIIIDIQEISKYRSKIDVS